MTDVADLFGSYGRDAFRLETRQVYRVPREGPRILAWRAGQPWPDEETPWQARLRAARARGARNRRVHMVDLPLSEYLQWEIEAYRRNALYGEEIRLLPRGDVPVGLDLPDDYWLFDDTTVLLMHYDDEGRLTGREIHHGDPSPYIAARDATWGAAADLERWCRQ